MEMVKLIESLARVTLSGDSMPDFTLANVACRTRFRTSNLYASFVEAKVASTLKAAKEARGEARMALARSCQEG